MADLTMWDILIRPIVTEKSNILEADFNQYVFEVHRDATKIQIADAIVRIFDVDVMNVRTMVMPPKRGRRGRKFYIRKQRWKKAIVTLAPGQSIDIYSN
jgi:large subunit ribosomal protein L23